MKITKQKLKQIIKEELDTVKTEGHGGEGSMARSQLGRTAELATMIQDMITDDSDLEEWVESKITKAQDYLTSVMNYMRGDQLSEAHGRHDYGARFDDEGEPEIASPYRKKPKRSYGSGMSDADREAYDMRQAERDPDREYIDMIKKIMKDMGMRVSAVPGDERQNRLLAQAIEELEME